MQSRRGPPGAERPDRHERVASSACAGCRVVVSDVTVELCQAPAGSLSRCALVAKRAPVGVRNRDHPNEGEQHTMDWATDSAWTVPARWAVIILGLCVPAASL